MFLGGSVPPWAGGAEGDGSPPAANCGIRAVRPLRYSGLRQALREKKRKSLRNHEISASPLPPAATALQRGEWERGTTGGCGFAARWVHISINILAGFSMTCLIRFRKETASRPSTRRWS